MNRHRHEQISRLFLRACEIAPESRAAFLRRACPHDAELRAEVAALLSYDQIGARLFHGAAVPATLAAMQREAPTPAVRETPPEVPGYRILGRRGAGGMGEVHLAEDVALGRKVAIKTLHPHSAEWFGTDRFVREARALASVEHPNVVRVYAFGETAGRSYLVMEYVEGESLAARLRRMGRLSVEVSLTVASQTAAALEAAWEHGVVHRDVKPANILIDARERVRVVDFGLAKKCGRSGRVDPVDWASAGGTPDYVSPEQALGTPSPDFRADIYSLGIVLYEMLAGERPFRGETAWAVIQQQVRAPLPPLPQRRPAPGGEVERLCRWMTAKQPDDRPASYGELRQTIEALLGRSPPRTTAARANAPVPGDDASAAIARAPFVGRVRELRDLDRFLDRALAGSGRTVFVVGEAGTGKTALVTEFGRRAQARHAELIVARGNCDAQTGAGDPYLPFREVLGQLTGDVESACRSGAIGPDLAGRLWDLLPDASRALVDEGPGLVGTFLAEHPLLARARAFTPRPMGWRHRLERLVRRNAERRTEALRRSSLFDQYTRTLRRLAGHRPLLLEIEDLHWADAGSCSLLFHLARSLTDCRALILCSYRPADVELRREGRPHPLKSVVNELQRFFGRLEVELRDEQTLDFTDALVDCEPNLLGTEFREALHRRTLGHPLFTVELLRSMRENRVLVRDPRGRWIEGSRLDWSALPARVEATIRERIDRLPDELRQALRVASVQGESFLAEVLARVQGIPESDMVRLLSAELDGRHHLVQAQGVRPRDRGRLSTYRFRHILFQAYLYDRLGAAERAYLHEAVGGALETLFADRPDEVAVQIARHFEEAAVVAKTLRYLRLAADRAVRLSANEQALAHYRKALGLLEGLPAGNERDREELALQLALGAPLMDTAGPGCTALSRAYTRALALCDRVGESSQRFQALFLLIHYHANRGEIPRTHELAEQLVQVAGELEDPVPAILAYWARGFARHYLGRFEQARADHDRVIELYDPRAHASLAYVYGMEPAVSALSYNGVTAWCLGFPERAEEYSRRALACARERKHASTSAHALTQACILALFSRDLDALHVRSEALLRLSTDKGVVLFRAWGTIFRGCVLLERGRPRRAVALLREGLAATRSAGSRLSLPVALAKSAQACWRAGERADGARLMAEAIAAAADSGEHQFEAELERLEGERLLASGSREQVESRFRRAVAIARRQRARSWELRATTSLARLLRDEGRVDEARRELGAAYDGFAEARDAPDRREAELLLERLS